jgi:LPXTG-motif cell wall-anchored protein
MINELVKVLANGTLDSSFGTSGTLTLAESEFNFNVTASGSIIVGGANSATPADATIRKFSSAGVLDTSWATGGILTLARIGSQGDDNFVNDVAVDSSGRLYAAILSSSMQSQTSTTKLFRFLADGTVDSSFGGGVVLPSSILYVDDILILRDGNILVTAMSGMYSPEMGVALVSSSGVLDSAFATAFAVTQLGNCKLSDMGVTQGTNGEVFAFGSKYGAASSGSLWKLIFSGVTGGGGSNVDTPSTPATPAADTPSTPATTAAVPTLVTSANAAALVRTPGSESIIVNGEEVVIESNTVNIPAARTPESQRTPAQVASIQQAGAALLQQFLASLPAGATSNVVVVNTATGAVMQNLVFDANGNAIDVPVEDIVFLDGPQLSLMIGSSNASITADGKYQVGAGGVVGVTGAGLGASANGEIIAMSTPTLLANFQTTAAGDFNKSATLPESIGVGDHTLVVAAGSTYALMGIRVVPGALPSTGSSTENVVIIALFTLVFGALFFRGRRISLI